MEMEGGAPKGKKARQDEKERKEAERLQVLLFGNLDLPGPGSSEEDDPNSANHGELATKPQRTPAWEDEEEALTSVDLSHKNRLRKLRRREDESVVSAKEYVSRLRAYHEQLNPGASWAKLAPENEHQHRSLLAGDPWEDDDDDDFLLHNTDLVVKSKVRLPDGVIEISRMRDANAEESSKAVIQSVEFHKNAQILLTAGFDKRLRFFQIDGRKNPKVQSIFLEDFPIHKAAFVPDGSTVIAASRRNFIYIYDMQHGVVQKIRPLVGREEKSLESFEVSPDANLAAFLGNEGYILLTSLKTKQLAGTLKMNGTVRSVAFAANGNELLSSGGDGEIYHWDLRTRRCIHKAVDEGCIKSTALSVSPNSAFFATGSDSGVVNLYDRATFFGGSIRPLKAFMNLLTTVDNLKFNFDSQILAMSSRMKKNAVRLVHVPSCTVFSNWPTAKAPLHYVHCMNFSPGGGLLAVGNAAGKVLLYRLRHYEQA